MNKDQLPFLVALQSVPGLGPVRLKILLAHFSKPQEIWQLPTSQLSDLGLPKSVVQNFLRTRQTLSPEKFFSDIFNQNVSILTIYDEAYPYLLKQIYDPPIILYYQGDLAALQHPTIAIVGSRKMTGYGKLATTAIGGGLADTGVVVVSGLARGVDTIAHQTALDHHAPTIAVLAGGLDKIFPSENIRLAQQIRQNGLLLSEFPPASPHLPANFPSRNRLISGLSIATLITEADLGSGSLITAQQTLDNNRPIFAVPGPINSQLSTGTNLLIRNGAILTTSAEDILEQLGINSRRLSELPDPTALDGLELHIFELLNQAASIDDLARQLKTSASVISAALLKLEIAGFVTNLGNGNFAKK